MTPTPPDAAPLAPLSSYLLAGAAGIRHGFFTREGGVSAGIYRSLNLGAGSDDDALAVQENRRRVAAFFGVPAARLLTVHQVHSAEVVSVEGPFPAERPRCDGVCTRSAGLVVAALHADCAPVLLADPAARVVCAVHAGWRGALGGVVEAGVAAMVRQGARSEAILAAVGPCIGPRSYEVGADFLEAFQRQDPASDRFFAPCKRPEKRLFDLPGYVLERLGRAGVTKAESLARDTLEDERLFFSNRRRTQRGEADYGRLISAIALEPLG